MYYQKSIFFLWHDHLHFIPSQSIWVVLLQNSHDCQIMSMWAMRRKFTNFHGYRAHKRKFSLYFVNLFNVMVIWLSKVTNDGHLLLWNTKKHVGLMLIFIIILHITSDCHGWGRIETPNVIYWHFKTFVYEYVTNITTHVQ